MRTCQALTDSGHAVTLCGFHGPGGWLPDEDYFDFYGLRGGFQLCTTGRWRWPLSRPQLVRHVRAVAAAVMPDLVYARLCLLPLVELMPACPLVFEMHTPGPIGEFAVHRWLFERVMNRPGGSRLIVTTQVLKAYLEERYPNQEIVLARLSAELPIEIGAHELAKFKANQGLDGDEFQVGYTGFLDNMGLRGIHTFSRLRRSFRSVVFMSWGGPKSRYVIGKDKRRPIIFTSTADKRRTRCPGI